MILSILQPVYLPWLGYFEQIAYSNHFVLLDDVQYTRHDWRNRNRIKTSNGTIWLTVPVKKHPRDILINEVEIDYSKNWIRKHLGSIEFNYKMCTYFRPLFNDISEILEHKFNRLIDLDYKLIKLFCAYLDINSTISFSSDIQLPESIQDKSNNDKIINKNTRIIEICNYHNASYLYDGAKSAEFIDKERFRNSGINVIFQNYQHHNYPQVHGDFISHLSIVDLIMNTGDMASEILRNSPIPPELPV